uniref:CCHC-type domain-containing protein n=1 Tax=Populus alba TaxID=43335 RepID=A0A4U5QLF6_POPAL|nr:hypothetical protein D5086_0000071770 [Populus alba]
MTVSIDSRILHLEQLCAEIQQRISTIHEYFLLQASNGIHVDPQKENEIQSLKIQLKSLQAELVKSKSKPLPFPEPPQNRMTSYYLDPYWAKHSSSYNPQPPPATPQLFGNPDTEKLFKPLPKRDKGKTPSFLTTYSQQTIPKILTHEPFATTSEEETPNDETLVTSEESFTKDDSSKTCRMPPLLMVDPHTTHSSDPQSSRTQQEPPSTSTRRFSVDEPVSSDDKVNLNPRHYQPHINSPSIDGDYRQMQFVNSASLSKALGWLHYEFLGEALNDKEIAWYEYFKMKCCYYLRSDLERHFKDMCRRYHILSGPDDPSLKHAFLTSIPRDLVEETFILFKTRKEVIDNQSLDTIFHHVLETLNKMCDQHKYFTKILQHHKTMLHACKRPDLLSKCSDNVDCNCPLQKKKHFKKIHRSSFNGRQKKWKFLRRRHTRCPKHFTSSFNGCFICKRKGHFAKTCPKKKAQYLKLIDFLAQNTKFNPDDDKVESLFSLMDKITPDTIATVVDESSDDDIYELYQAQPTITSSHQIPLAPVTILTSTYAKPIKAIALFDTGVYKTILNPKVLPPYYWVTRKDYFRATNNQVFCTQYKIKKPITIQIMPPMFCQNPCHWFSFTWQRFGYWV